MTDGEHHAECKDECFGSQLHDKHIHTYMYKHTTVQRSLGAARAKTLGHELTDVCVSVLTQTQNNTTHGKQR
eukprot:m.10029 g.10029  ORF g.10029 m.10029 type:complete len:72 (+) comp3662_c0_seq1:625-840(+)